jgi:hypothetical protein
MITQCRGNESMRIGTGYDIHPLVSVENWFWAG